MSPMIFTAPFSPTRTDNVISPDHRDEWHSRAFHVDSRANPRARLGDLPLGGGGSGSLISGPLHRLRPWTLSEKTSRTMDASDWRTLEGLSMGYLYIYIYKVCSINGLYTCIYIYDYICIYLCIYLVTNWALANLSQKKISAVRPGMAVLISHSPSARFGRRDLQNIDLDWPNILTTFITTMNQ